MKVYILLSAFLLCILNVGDCQKNDSTKVGKFSIGIAGSPDYSYRYLGTDGSSSASTVKNIRDTTEKSKTAFTAGIALLFSWKKHINFESGLFLSDKGYKTKGMVARWPNGTTSQSGGITYKFYYIDVPLIVNYVFAAKRFAFFIGAGPVLNLLVTSESIFNVTEPVSNITYNTVEKGNPGLGPVDLSVNAGLGMSYKFSKHISGMLQPIFRYSVVPIVTGTPVKEHVYSFGVNTGIYYRL